MLGRAIATESVFGIARNGSSATNSVFTNTGVILGGCTGTAAFNAPCSALILVRISGGTCGMTG